MFQRLLVLLLVLSAASPGYCQNIMTPNDPCYKYNPAAPLGDPTNPNLPATNRISQWIHDPSQSINTGHRTTDTIGSNGFDQSTYKCYIWNSLPYRIRFPNNYNPNNPTPYPVIVFLHGAGEAAGSNNPDNLVAGDPDARINRENEDQLYWGAQLFEQRMNQGEWNGFLIFPQIMDVSAQWDDSHFPDINHILDTLKKYNNADLDRVIAMGLSAGGFGGVNYAYYHPDRIAAVVVANPRFIEGLGDANSVSHFAQIPIWLAAGGQDIFPDPGQVLSFRDGMATAGGNIYFSYYPLDGHISWVKQWISTDVYSKLILSNYWNSAHKAQPLLYFNNSQFCSGQPISAKMGLTAGFYAYEWQYDNGSGFATIPGAVSNIYTATKAGRYRARFKHADTSAQFSAWSPSPIVISTKSCAATDTAFVEHFDSPVTGAYVAFNASGSAGSAYTYENLTCQNGLFVNSTEVFSQDAKGVQGDRFMLNNTSSSGCTYSSGDQVWRTYYPANVTPHTNYTLSFYMGNQAENITYPTDPPYARISASINNVILSPSGDSVYNVGNLSWKKYSFVWNSGNSSTAEIALRDSTTDPNGNDFAIDEISLVKYKPVPMPGAAFTNVALWAKADILPGADSSNVSVWPNSNINGNQLIQADTGEQPVLRDIGSNNINFNQTVFSSSTLNTFMRVPGGFLGTKPHDAVTAFGVYKSNNISGKSTLLYEPASSGPSTVGAYFDAQGTVQWFAGDVNTSAVYSANNVNELNKPILWSFSKNNIAGTGSGNKQDIRKNGIVIGSNNSVSQFMGGYDLNAGPMDGNLAELIYIIDSTVTASSQNKIESYLAIKYGISQGSTTAPVSYTATDNTVYWTANPIYQNDVFGIGKDSLTALLQTVSNSVNSGSGDGTGQAAKGNLVLSANSTLTDKQFLMIGNDAGTLTQHMISSTAEAPHSLFGSYILGRKWKVANTGVVGAVTLSFDTTGLQEQQGGSVVNNYALLIDQDGNGNFSDGALTIFGATSAAGKKINFSGLTLNNGVVFTLITFKNALLPAVWLGFTAEAVNGNGVLNWKTGDEINVDSYTVEHSFNGATFTAVGTVAANNNTGENDYTFTDPNLSAGVHYYRIRRTDKDGKIEYSDVKSIKITTNGANVVVRPNPVTGSTLTVGISVQQNTKTTMEVMSVDGKILLQQNISLVSGTNTINLNIANIPSGIYLVQVRLSDDMVTKKFIKQP